MVPFWRQFTWPSSFNRRDRQILNNGSWYPQFGCTTSAEYYVFWHSYLFRVKILVIFCMVDLWVNSTLSDSTVLHVVKWYGSFATSLGAVKAWNFLCVAAIVKDDYLFRCHAGHLRLACNLFPFVIFNYDWWYPTRPILWTAHSCFWRRWICFSFLQLPTPQNRPALVLTGAWSFTLGSILDIYRGLFYEHPPRIARVCSVPLYTPCLGAEYIFVSRLNQYQK